MKQSLNNHSLVKLLRTFSKEDIKRFGEMLTCGYFNKRKQPVSIYKELVKYYPLFTDIRLTPANIYKTALKTENYNQQALRVLLSMIQSLAVRYIKYKGVDDGLFESEEYLLKELLQRDCRKLFVTNYSNIANIRKDNKIHHSFFHNQYRLQKLNLDYLATYKQNKINSPRSNYLNSINNSSFNITISYFMQVTELYMNYIQYREKFNIPYRLPFPEAIIKNINFNEFYGEKVSAEYSFIIELYSALLYAFSDLNNSSLYYDYKKVLMKYSAKLNQDELSFHYQKLIALCILIKRYDKNFENELFGLYKDFVQGRLYKTSEVNFLDITHYRNIVNGALKLNENKWAYNFIVNYSGELQEEIRDSITDYTYASYYFNTGDYNKSKDFLKRIKLDYFQLKYEYRELLLKLHFECNEFEQVLSLVTAYRNVLSDDKHLKLFVKKKIRNFLFYLEKLTLDMTGSYKGEIEYLRIRLNAEDNVNQRDWLLDKYGFESLKERKSIG